MIEKLIQERVNLAMGHKFRMELTSPATGQALTPVERRAFRRASR